MNPINIILPKKDNIDLLIIHSFRSDEKVQRWNMNTISIISRNRYHLHLSLFCIRPNEEFEWDRREKFVTLNPDMWRH